MKDNTSQYRGLTKGSEIALKALGVEKKEGYRVTKAIRFYLPAEQADRWETMKKQERNAIIKTALEIY